MKLHTAARRFDRTPAADAYTPATTFLCQLAPLDLYKIDATAVKRREMSCAPSVTIPTRQAITIDGQVFLVGDGSSDQWEGTKIRTNYVLQGADHLASLTTIAAALANTAATSAYASLDFSKFQSDSRESADYLPQYQIFIASAETKPELIQAGGVWYLVKEGYLSVSGLQSLLTNELRDPVFETITYGARTYAPVTDTWSGTTSSVKIFRVRWTEHFRYLTKASENYERGDMQVFVLKSALTPKVSDKLTLSDGAWTVLSIQDEGLTWSLHVRR